MERLQNGFFTCGCVKKFIFTGFFIKGFTN